MKTNDLFDWKIPDLDKSACSRGIQDFIIQNILASHLKINDMLPSYRKLAEINGISPSSVRRAYTRLMENSWIDSRYGSGTFVSQRGLDGMQTIGAAVFKEKFPFKIEQSQKTSIHPVTHMKSFAFVGTDFPAPFLFPEEKFSKYRHRHRLASTHLSQGELLNAYQGEYLKNAIIDNLKHHWGVDINSNLLEIIQGREESLKKIFSKLLTNEEDVVVNTCLHDTTLDRILMDSSSAVVWLSPTENNFLKSLEQLLQKMKVKAIYVKPQSSFPEGRTLLPEECLKLIELAKSYKAAIVEECEDHEFYLEPLPYRPLAFYDHEGFVIYLAALSKATPYMQSLRLVMASAELITVLREFPATLENRDAIKEMAIADLFIRGDMDRYRRHARLAARKNRDILDMILQNYLSEYLDYSLPEHGLTFWLYFRNDLDLNLILKKMEEVGIAVPYHPNHLGTSGKINYMLLGFGAFDITEAEGAAKILREIIESM